MSDLTLTPLPPTGITASHAGLPTCSLCLSVWHGGAWVAAEHAIHLLQTFSFWDAPRLAPGLCDDCRSQLAARRGRQEKSAA